MIFVLFWIFAVLVMLGYLALWPAVTPDGVLIALALGFLGANVLFALLFTVNSFFRKGDWPIQKQSRLCRWICAAVGQWICGYAGMKPKLIGMDKLPHDRPFLFVCNHRSMFDPLLVMGRLDSYNISFVSKPSNLRIPIAGVTAIQAGFLPIDREDNRAALKTILAAADYLKRGVCSIGIYPEGTRSRNGELGAFHAGSFKIAQKADAPVAICCVRGTEQVAKPLFLVRTRVELEVLEVLDADKVKAMKTTELAAYARDRIWHATT